MSTGTVTINSQQLDIDISEELEPFLDKFDKYRLRDNKLQSCSPFRYDSHPSFAVNLENGTWIDSGAVDHFHKGHFIQLLSFLREEQFEDTADYLITKYGIQYKEIDKLQLDMSWTEPQKEPTVFTTEDLQPYAFRHPYLANRGISETVQRAFRIGYDRQAKAVMMPWTNKDGQVVNMKFRSVETKKFWYHSEGQRVKYHLFGLDKILKHNHKTVYVCESEIDALKLWTHGLPAVATGTASMSDIQKQLLLNSPVETLVIAADNDQQGYKFKRQLIQNFTGIFKLGQVKFQSDWKDIGDIPDNKVKEHCEQYNTVYLEFGL